MCFDFNLATASSSFNMSIFIWVEQMERRKALVQDAYISAFQEQSRG